MKNLFLVVIATALIVVTTAPTGASAQTSSEACQGIQKIIDEKYENVESQRTASTVFKSIAIFAGTAGGSMGITSIPVTDEGAKTGLAIAAGISGAVSAIAVAIDAVLSESYENKIDDLQNRIDANAKVIDQCNSGLDFVIQSTGARTPALPLQLAP